MKKCISWSKYQDIRKLFKSPEEYEKELEGEGEESDDGDTKSINLSSQAIITQLGVLPLTDGVMASDNFDFWIMHTNFDITPLVLDTISKVPGVESLEALTRYRVRIGFPIGETVNEKGERIRMFESATVKKEIEEILVTPHEQHNINIDTFIQETFNQDIFNNFCVHKNGCINYNYWNILILPNGNFEIRSTDNLNEFSINHKLLEDTAQMSGGLHICSQEYNQ